MADGQEDGVKFISFERDGKPGFGVAVDGEVIELTGRIRGARSLKDLLAHGDIEVARSVCERSSRDFALDDCTLLPVIPNPAKIICLGLNYRTHAEECGKPLPPKPVVFHRHAQTLVAHGQPLLRPAVSEQFDYEGELAVILGKRGGHIREEDALAHVAGYACFNEASVRDWQRHSHLYGMGKNFRSTGALGPWLVTTEEIPDPSVLQLRTLLNGEQVQATPLDDLIFSVPQLISYVSQAIDWLPGDVLVTGTPSGVGLFRDPPRFLRSGDVVEVQISGIGGLVNPVRDERDGA
jgi:2-keto-4-pentenoate hydratase/2-oxohepta-3-ene-1,7-dioic acid hydratase in catechol pathway